MSTCKMRLERSIDAVTDSRHRSRIRSRLYSDSSAEPTVGFESVGECVMMSHQFSDMGDIFVSVNLIGNVESDPIARRSLRETRRYAFSASTMGACLSTPPKTEPSEEQFEYEQTSEGHEESPEDFDLFE